MRKYKAIFFFLAAFISHLSLDAQYYKKYNTSNGLISNNVYQVNCDSKGYLWFCTDKGVVRYDGKIFETYTIANGLTDNEVFNCYEDLNGRIWFYTFNGVFCYYKNGIIYNKYNSLLIKKIKEYSFLSTVYENPNDSSLYFGHVYGPIQKLHHNQVSIITVPVGSYNKIRTITPMLEYLKVFSHKKTFLLRNDSLYSNRSHELSEAFYYNDRLLISDGGGVSLYNNEKLVWRIKDPDVTYGSVLHLFYDTNGYVFCGTIKGLIVYNIYTGSKQFFFKNTRISSSKTDLDGNYWITTFGNGVYFFSKANLTDIQMLKNTKDYDFIKSSSGQIFLKKNDQVEILKKNATSLEFEKIKFGIPQNAVPVIYSNNILYYHELDSGGISHSINNVSGVRTKLPYDFFKAFSISDKNFVLFNSNNLFHTKIVNGVMKKHSSVYFSNRLSAQKYIEEQNSIYFISGKNILFKYTCSDYHIQAIDTIDNIGSDNCIFYDQGKVYVSGNNGYIYAYEAITNKMLNTVKPEVVIYDVVKIKENNFLVNTNKGYKRLRINKDSFLFSNVQYPFLQNDIMFIYPFYKHMICKTGDELYSFSPDIINKQITIPQLYLHSIIVNAKKISGNNISAEVIDKAQLDIHLRTVYYGTNKLIYRYRIIEITSQLEEWHYTKGEQLSFTVASRGEYKIEVQVAEVGGSFSDSQVLYLTILPSFFNSIWFLLICTILILGLVLLIISYISKKRKATFANEMSFLKLEHRATSALLNPHFIFNAINNIQNLINQNSKELAREYLATLSTMIRQNIDNLQYHLISLNNEIRLVENYIELQNLRFSKKVHFELKNDVEKECFIPPLLIQTFVENAIVHGYNKQQEDFKINISILYTIDDYLIIKILDNGKGISITNKKEPISNKDSIGISFTDKRLKRLSTFCKKEYKLSIEDLANRDGHTSGTEVVIVLFARMKEYIGSNK